MNTLFNNLESWLDKFECFWQQASFRKIGKTEARRRLRSSVRTEQDWAQLYEAHERYKADQKANPWRQVLYGGTFASRWRDYLDLEPIAPPVKLSVEERYKIAKGVQ